MQLLQDLVRCHYSLASLPLRESDPLVMVKSAEIGLRLLPARHVDRAPKPPALLARLIGVWVFVQVGGVLLMHGFFILE